MPSPPPGESQWGREEGEKLEQGAGKKGENEERTCYCAGEVHRRCSINAHFLPWRRERARGKRRHVQSKAGQGGERMEQEGGGDGRGGSAGNPWGKEEVLN